MGSVLNQNTKVPLIWLISGLFFGAGGVFWLTSIYATATQAKEGVEKLDLKIENKMHSLDQKLELLYRMDSRLTRIESELRRINNQEE